MKTIRVSQLVPGQLHCCAQRARGGVAWAHLHAQYALCLTCGVCAHRLYAGAVWQRTPKLVPKLAGTLIVDAACGADHTLALDSNGRAWAFGRCEHEQCFGTARRPFTAAPTVSAALSGADPGADSGNAQRLSADGNCSCSFDSADRLLKCIGRCSPALCASVAGQKS